MHRSILVLAAVVSLAACRNSGAENTAVDPQLARAIAQIKAIDHHAHPVRPVQAGETRDSDYDALPVETLAPTSDPVRMRTDAPHLTLAQRAVANVKGKPEALLDLLGIEAMFANRVSMGPGLPASRFLWVPFDDTLMYPLDNTMLAANSDRQAFFEDEDQLLKRYYADLGIAPRPAALEEYMSKVVRPTLERQKQNGAVAIKFEMAYLRAFDIGDPSREEAEAAWRSGKSGKALQDFLFRFIAAEAGRLKLPIHLHTGEGGGGFFNIAGSNPYLLEPLLDDPAMRGTTFVMVHGGWPFAREVAGLLQKPNVYADFSAQTLVNPPSEVVRDLHAWLVYEPEKVFFGTDAYPYAKEMGWEESGYLAANSGREALGRALTQMMRDGDVTRERAEEIARLVLRDNVRRVYGLK